MERKITISAHNITVNDQLKKHIDDKFKKYEKYFGDHYTIHIFFAIEAGMVKTNIEFHDLNGTHKPVVANNIVEQQIIDSFNKAFDTLDYQIFKIRDKERQLKRGRSKPSMLDM